MTILGKDLNSGGLGLAFFLAVMLPAQGWAQASAETAVPTSAVRASAVRAAPASEAQIHLSFAPVVRKAAPAVVTIFSPPAPAEGPASALRHDPALSPYFPSDDQVPANTLGSGVIVGTNGTIVTNRHVIADAPEIWVALSDRREFKAKVIRSDPRTDLAVLKIDVGSEQLPFLELRGSDELEVGDLVLAIGNPFGVGQTVTSGIVSALARAVKGISDYRTYIQTDAAINPGNSGGALVDLDGKLIGIPTALYSENGGSVGIGFAIPSELVRAVLADGTTGSQRIVRPWFGAEGRSVTASLARRLGLPRPEGVQITGVAAEGPAAEAGLVPNDVVLAVDGRPVDDEDALRFRFATLAVGTHARLTLWRQGTTSEVQMRLLAPPETPPREITTLRGGLLSGLTVANLSPALADELNIDETSGVILLDISGMTALRRGKLEAGDILVDIAGQEAVSVDQVRGLAPRLAGPTRLAVRRNGRVLRLTIG